jgi:phosphohistidine phosphatase
MKTLLLLRHAQPSPTSPTGRDFDRPLVEKGRRAASLVGQLLRRRQLTPGVVISSPAARAQQTAEHVIDAAKFTTRLLFDRRAYEATAEQLIELISEVEDEVETVLFVAHNPGLQELLMCLTGAHAPMLPATLARIDLDIDTWNKLRASQAGQLIFALSPEASEGH